MVQVYRMSAFFCMTSKPAEIHDTKQEPFGKLIVSVGMGKVIEDSR